MLRRCRLYCLMSMLAMLPLVGLSAGCRHVCCGAPLGCGHCSSASQACADGGAANLAGHPPVAPTPPLAAPQARLLPVPTRPVFLPGSFGPPPQQMEIHETQPRPFQPPPGQPPAPLQRPSVGQPPGAGPVPDAPRRDRLTSDKPLANVAREPQVRPTAWVFAP